MKKIQILFSIVILFAVSVSLSFGQVSNKNKYVEITTTEVDGTVVCSHEAITGSFTVTETWWTNGKYQWRIDGTYYGALGNVYEISGVHNVMQKDFVPGQAYSYTDIFNDVLYMNGEEFAILQYKVHYTVNANGEVTSDWNKGEYIWECLMD